MSIAVAGLVALVVGLCSRAPLEEVWVNPLANAQFTRFTDFPGTETLAAISPDGRFVAFLSDQDGPFNLWLSQVDTGRFANLTKDLPHAGLQPQRQADGLLRRRGEVSFLTGGRRVLMPLIGGMPRPFLQPTAQQPSWSPDGTQPGLRQWRRTVIRCSSPIARGSNAREIFKDQRGAAQSQSGLVNRRPVDLLRTRAGCVGARWTCGEFGLREVLRNGLRRHGAAITFVAPLDPRTLLYVAPAEDRSGPWLWALDVERQGLATRVSAGLEQVQERGRVERWTARGGNGRESSRKSVARAASWTAWPTTRDVDSVCSADRARARARAFAGPRCSISPPRGTGDGLWRL